MTTKLRSKAAQPEGSHRPQKSKGSSESPAAAKPERSSADVFSSLIRSIDNNLSIAHQLAGEAKRRLG